MRQFIKILIFVNLATNQVINLLAQKFLQRI